MENEGEEGGDGEESKKRKEGFGAIVRGRQMVKVGEGSGE